MRGPSGAQGGEALLKQALALLEDAVSAYRKSGSRSNTLIEGSTAVAFPALAAYRSTGEQRFLEIAEQLAAEVGAPHDNEYALGAEKAVEMASYLRPSVSGLRTRAGELEELSAINPGWRSRWARPASCRKA